MENLESNETNVVEKKSKTNFKLGSISPKVVAILLIINLVIGIINLAGIGYLSFKNNDRGQMMQNFRNGGMQVPPNGNGNGGMFNQ
ncbi:hypothetical protein [Bacillus sp. EAC]|uniref:hypothetical protein n=1 Tax=Bacillus sp. EAC TaxID=1978338 RepID=UPI000B44D1C8|nr:hypothetical protein [Bacillus sp. EAC]